MANKTKLNRKVIDEIVELLKLRLTWIQIADAVGVTVQTLKNWRNLGLEAREQGKRNIYCELVDRIDAARTEMIKGYSQNVRNAALHESETVTTEVVEHKDGSISKKTTTKTEPPNATLAMKILGMEMPEVWAENQNVNVNWQQTLESQGQDPDGIKAIVKAYLEQRKAEGTDDATAATTDDTA